MPISICPEIRKSNPLKGVSYEVALWVRRTLPHKRDSVLPG
jgi:hypothetical protein